MAHTFEGKTVRIFHNGGFDGDCTLICKTIADSGLQFQVDFEDLKAFVASYIRSEMIDKIEQATPDEIIKGLIR